MPNESAEINPFNQSEKVGQYTLGVSGTQGPHGAQLNGASVRSGEYSLGVSGGSNSLGNGVSLSAGKVSGSLPVHDNVSITGSYDTYGVNFPGGSMSAHGGSAGVKVHTSDNMHSLFGSASISGNTFPGSRPTPTFEFGGSMKF